MCVLQRKTGHIWKTVKDTAKVTIIAIRKWHTPFQMTWKSWTLDDLRGHWQSVRSAILATLGLLVYHCRIEQTAVKYGAWRIKRTQQKMTGFRFPIALQQLLNNASW